MLVLATLLTACGGEELSWSDDFSDPSSGWLAESDASAEVEYRDGTMHVLVKAPNSLAWASIERELDDFRVAVEATQAGGPDDNEYGVLVRMQDADHFYCFSISGDGYYLVSKYDGKEWEALSGDDWLPADAINLGMAMNLIEIVCQGTTMTFLVNGVQLATVEDNSYSRGGIGLYAGSFFEPDVQVYFDNLRVDSP
jgi:hypothetical protein